MINSVGYIIHVEIYEIVINHVVFLYQG